MPVTCRKLTEGVGRVRSTGPPTDPASKVSFRIRGGASRGHPDCKRKCTPHPPFPPPDLIFLSRGGRGYSVPAQYGRCREFGDPCAVDIHSKSRLRGRKGALRRDLSGNLSERIDQFRKRSSRRVQLSRAHDVGTLLTDDTRALGASGTCSSVSLELKAGPACNVTWSTLLFVYP